MGRHYEWRKIVKRERRRKRRVKNAIQRDSIWDNNIISECLQWFEDLEALEQFEMEQIEKSNKEEHEKWLQAEKIALEKWQQILKNREKLKELQIEKEIKAKLEYEREKQKKIEEEIELKRIEEEQLKKQKLFKEKLEQFMNGNLVNPPSELLITRETRPDSVVCPFFTKTASCRFGDQCSRNHQYPGVSKVLLATNFYIHFGLDNNSYNEYDTDVMLEYEDSDTYRDFQNFFYDVLPEFEKFGKIVQFKVSEFNNAVHNEDNYKSILYIPTVGGTS